MKPVLIFDLDDTLILQDKMTTETVRYVTAFLGLDADIFGATFQQTCKEAFEGLSCADWCRMVGISAQEALWGDFGGAHQALQELRRDLARFRFEAWHRALDAHGFPEPELAHSIAADFALLRGRKYYTFPGARDIVQALKPHFGLAILTNGAPELQWSKVHASGLEDLFDTVTVSGDYGIGKPRREIFEIVMAKHPGAPGFIMIGNSLTSDIRGARNAGIPCIWFVQGDEPTDVPVRPDGVIRSLSDLPRVLDEVLPLLD